jgi:hypothetical protein|tara:strand:+ start:86 stop:274 length:189 start_codon:yes stop_codon:yes gene_type:complete
MKVGDLLKIGNNLAVIAKIHSDMEATGLSDLYEILWLKTNTTTRMTKVIMEMYGCEVINEDR